MLSRALSRANLRNRAALAAPSLSHSAGRLPVSCTTTTAAGTTALHASGASLYTHLRVATAAFSTSTARHSSVPKPAELDAAEEQIWDILAAEFAPTALFVRDVSGGCGSMYAIEIASGKFAGLSMLKQQRLVNAALGDLVKGWHGLQLRTRAA
ncbi:hypothetical protein BROUX41_004199 [Berkeleyomyces rouxiae]|uniref:uncharacterized protein n=1 Tax=Berkeleyomyces rouxiae TaxID=2035830 RepID=UPI003B8133AA